MRDPLLGLANATIKTIWAVSDALRRPAVPTATGDPLRLMVSDREVVAHDQNVVAFTLVDVDGRALPIWHPGAHLDLHLPSGRVRQYSLCGAPPFRSHPSPHLRSRPVSDYRIAVRRIPDGGGGSIEMHDDMPIGSVVTTSGPRNAFPLIVPGYGSPTTRLRFIAGGIGITPILPMLGLAEHLGADWSMIYVGRSADSIPFLDEVRRYEQRRAGRVEIRTDDVHGIPTADDLLGQCLSGTTVYACGPAPMLTLIRDRLVGRDDVELHFERFAAPPVVDGARFTVAVRSTGAEIAVAPDETLLAALQRAGVTSPYSCQQGFCGTCRTRVLDVRNGVVQHRDSLLTELERQSLMLTCVSRGSAGSTLVLDL